MFTPKIKLNIISDPDDNKFLELAEICNADFLIMGNTKYFQMSSFEQTKIMAPKRILETISLIALFLLNGILFSNPGAEYLPGKNSFINTTH
jgi:hypothetical protein